MALDGNSPLYSKLLVEILSPPEAFFQRHSSFKDNRKTTESG